MYEKDSTISRLNKELIFNDINVYRIYDNNNLEDDFFKMINDKSNK